MEAWETPKRLKPGYLPSTSEKRRWKLAQDLRMHLDTTDSQERVLVRKALGKAIEMLPQKQRDYLTLYFGRGLRMEDIAQMRGVDKSTVSRTIKRARINLYKYLQFTSVRFLNDSRFIGHLTEQNRRRNDGED